MAKMTKAQARRRIEEAQLKLLKVYLASNILSGITLKEMDAIDRICNKAKKKLK